MAIPNRGTPANRATANLPQYKAKRAAATIGAGLCRIAFMGDSITAGYPTFTGGQSWPIRARNMLLAAGYPIAGQGWVPVVNGPNFTKDPRWTLSGNWQAVDTTFGANIAMPHAVSYTVGNTATYTSQEPGTVASVLYLNTSASFTVSIDGGTAVTITPDGSESTAAPYVVTGLLNTVHTIKITVTGTAGTFVTAAEVRQATGIVFDNWGYTSSMATWFNQSAGYDYVAAVAATTPDLVVMCWGVNEIGAQTGAQYQAALDALAVRLGARDYVMCTSIPTDANGTGYQAVNSQPMRDAVYAEAQVLGCPVFDFYARWGGSSTYQKTLGMMQADNLHPSAQGYADMGLGFYRLLME